MSRNNVSTIVTPVLVTLTCAYPLLVYLGLTRFRTRTLGLVLLVTLLPLVLLRFRGQRREHLRAVLPLPIGVAALLLLGIVIEDQRFILALPVLINLTLLIGFASSLRGDLPLVERFARMQGDSLSPAELIYCRRVTQVWVGFFLVNAAIILSLGLYAPVSWWAFYVGVLSYMAMGLIFTVEYLFRKYRFRRYRPGWPDRVVKYIFPVRPS